LNIFLRVRVFSTVQGRKKGKKKARKKKPENIMSSLSIIPEQVRIKKKRE